MLENLFRQEAFFVSAISLWEVAKLVEKGRVTLPLSLADWFTAAISASGMGVLPITPEIATDSCNLPDGFHADPADQLIVATARIHECSSLTADGKILSYQHVKSMACGI